MTDEQDASSRQQEQVRATGSAAVAVGGDVKGGRISTNHVEQNIYLGPTIVGADNGVSGGPIERLRDGVTAELDIFLRDVDRRPVRMPVRWHRQRHGVDQREPVTQASAGGPAPESTDDVDGIVSLYDGVASHRLVIVGPGGSGKTVIAARLALALLARHDGPVPIIVPVGGWDTTRLSFRDWLVGRLRQMFAELKVSAPNGFDLPAVLLDKK